MVHSGRRSRDTPDNLCTLARVVVAGRRAGGSQGFEGRDDGLKSSRLAALCCQARQECRLKCCVDCHFTGVGFDSRAQ